MSYSATKPLNLNQALQENLYDGDLNLYLIEIGVFSQEDTNTAIDSNYVLVATESMKDAEAIAIDACEKDIGLQDSEYFSQMNEAECVESADYIEGDQQYKIARIASQDQCFKAHLVKQDSTLNITKNLNPSKNYSFQTFPSGRTLPMTVGQFANCSHAKEEIITVGHGIGKNKVWSVYEGWEPNEYANLVIDLVALIDKTQDVTANPEFIDTALDDELTVFDAVSSWFEGTKVSVKIEQHAKGSTGLIDIDIKGVHSVRRVVLDMNIKTGDIFNFYHGESSKGGAFWKGDLLETLNSFFEVLKKTKQLL